MDLSCQIANLNTNNDIVQKLSQKYKNSLLINHKNLSQTEGSYNITGFPKHLAVEVWTIPSQGWLLLETRPLDPPWYHWVYAN
jgi:hypothetical protein